MAIQGTLKTMNLTDLLQFLAAGRKTGTLRFDCGKITKQVYFKNGLIVGSKSNDPKEYLGQTLLHYGKHITLVDTYLVRGFFHHLFKTRNKEQQERRNAYG